MDCMTKREVTEKEREIWEALTGDDFSPIYEEADRIRQREKGDEVFIRAIIEFSNCCRRRCRYCGINADQRQVRRYRMSSGEILETAKQAIDAGYRTIVLQSGEDERFTGNGGEELAKTVRSIKEYDEDVAVTLSCGELPYDTYRNLREAGADRYLLRHETADAELYEKLHPCGTLEERLRCLRDIKALGYETGSGFMTGLPGADAVTTAKDLLLLKELECDMAGIGPFIAHPDTELAGAENGSAEMTKRAVAFARLLLPEANLPVTTALGVLSPREREKAFSCGANVIMKKVTPDRYKKDYDIYPADLQRTDIKRDRRKIEEMLEEIERIPV